MESDVFYMELIITEKNDAAGNIAKLLADGTPKADKVYDTPIYRFKRNGDDCVIIGLRGHILEVEFAQELVWSKKSGWVGLTAEGEVLEAPEVPDSLEKPPFKSKRKPFTAEGVDLKGWKIPALPYLTYAPLLKLPKEKGIIRSLKNLAKKADSVVIATDFDREGELIGLDALNVVLAENPNLHVSRARYSAFIKREIQEAFSAENLVGLDFNLAYAGESRQHIDLIWGAVLTRYLTAIKYSGIGNVRSAGRVQTPTLALVVKKEKERQAFIPEDYWVISGTFAPQGSPDESFTGNHVKGRFKVEAEANEAFAHIKDASSGTVESIEKKRRKVPVPAPFNTTSLQAAASRIGLRPSRTMRIAESLYMSGLISYPRVDNTVYPDLDYPAILNMLSRNPAFAPYAQAISEDGKKNGFHPTRGKQYSTDHPPIYPTGVGDPDKLRPEEWKLYNLIARRFMATLMGPATIEGTTVAVDVNGETLRAKGDVLVEPGFRSVYFYDTKKDEQLPVMAQGQVLDFSEPKLQAKQTEPPARYSSGKLVQEMEKQGLGTKATRADMIEKLYGRKYIVNDPIEPTQLGFAVIDALERFAPAITTPDMTAELEQEMTNIAEGKDQRDNVVNHSRHLLGEIMGELVPRKDEMAEAITEAVIADSRVGKCPKCGGDLCVKTSAKTRGSFVGCNSWPDCDVTYPLPQGRYDVVEEPCPQCGGVQIKVTPFRSKAYLHCLDPECASNREPSIDVGECPVCKATGRKNGHLMAQKNPRTLKRFIRCSNHPECENSYPLPQRGKLQATGEVCDACGAPEVIIDNGRGPWRICVNMDCPKREEEAKAKAAKKKAAPKKKTTAKKSAGKKSAVKKK